jgi:hypothetical protein
MFLQKCAFHESIVDTQTFLYVIFHWKTFFLFGKERRYAKMMMRPKFSDVSHIMNTFTRVVLTKVPKCKSTKIFTISLFYISLFYFAFVLNHVGLYSPGCSVESQAVLRWDFFIASVEVGLEANSVTIKYMLLSRH